MGPEADPVGWEWCVTKVDVPVLPFSGSEWRSLGLHGQPKDPKAEPSQFLLGPSSFPVTLCAQQVFVEVDRNVSGTFAGLGPGAPRQATAS